MGSHGALRDFQWTSYEKPRAPPPLPSLPPWAAQAPALPAASGNLPIAETGNSWRRPTSYFGAMKRLPTQVPQEPVDNVDDEERRGYDTSQQPEQDKREERASRREWLYGAPVEPAVSSPPRHTAPPTNQHEAEGDGTEGPQNQQRMETTDDPATVESGFVVEPLATHDAFFRPWKHTSDNNDDNNNDTGNKWKVRALMNPFAKKKPTATKPPAVEPEPVAASREEDEEPAAPSPVPLVRHGPVPRTPPPRRFDAAVQRAESTPTASPVALHRPRTPVLASPPVAAPTVAARPSRTNVRSREAVVLPHIDTPELPRVETAATSLPPALATLTDLRKSTAQLAPLDQSLDSLRRVVRDREDEDVASVLQRVPPKPPTQLQQLKQQHAQQKQKAKKGATLDALNEIKRKRDERRNAQAEEKQRMKVEVEQHGDDAGYKFRRLIQRYRDALPASQRAAIERDGAQTPVPTTQRLCVFVRKRPLAKKELKAKGYDILTCLFGTLETSTTTLDTTRRRELLCHEPKLKVDCSESLEHHQFHFDGVFDDDQDNETVYHATVGPLVPTLVDAPSTTSLTVFAYGQTGSGKTYTMKSMYRQAAIDLFARLGASAVRVSVGVSFYEIYMNQVNDLLNRRKRVQLMEDGDGVVQLLGLEQVTIHNADELMELIAIGEEARATSANAVHDDSSRSHALLRVTIASADGAHVLARLSMVDLAGSERACDTQSDGKNTRMEGAEINKSLLALKECIRALDRGASHIPFRQSKLTQLLRDSFLCANSKTVMIATVSPCSVSCNHTLNTLRYADRLKEIGAS